MPARDPAPLYAAHRRSTALLALACAGVLAACDNPNEVFSGRWESTRPAYDTVLQGAPVVAMGHYGREVAGVVYYEVVQGAGLLVEECPCTFIEHRDVDLVDRRLVFNTACGGVKKTWRLALDERGSDLFLVGTVRPADGSAGEVEVELENKARFVRDEDKECPPDGF